VEIDRERKDAAGNRGLDPVDKGTQDAEPMDVVPYVRTVCIKNVRPIAVDHDAAGGVAFRVTIAGNVRTCVNDPDPAIRFFDQLTGKDCSGKSGTDH
jgi:hypothetical protein